MCSFSSGDYADSVVLISVTVTYGADVGITTYSYEEKTILFIGMVGVV